MNNKVLQALKREKKNAHRERLGRENIKHAQINCQAFTLYLSDSALFAFP